MIFEATQVEWFWWCNGVNKTFDSLCHFCEDGFMRGEVLYFCHLSEVSSVFAFVPYLCCIVLTRGLTTCLFCSCICMPLLGVNLCVSSPAPIYWCFALRVYSPCANILALCILSVNPDAHAQKSIARLREPLIQNGNFVYCWFIALLYLVK